MQSLFQASDGKLWVGTDLGLAEFVSLGGAGGKRFRGYTAANGLSTSSIAALAEDCEGNLWMASEGGVMRFARRGFTRYDARDGLPHHGIINSIFEDRAGALCVVIGGRHINRFDGKRFRAILPDTLDRVTDVGWGWYQLILQDHTGEWWVPAGRSLFVYPRVRRPEELAHTPPKVIYTSRDGLPAGDIFRLYEDSRGDIWIGMDQAIGVARWERSRKTIQSYTAEDGLTVTNGPTAFGEDRFGNVWVGFWAHDLARYRNGRFRVFTANDGLPPGLISALYLDHAGRLWAGTTRGGLVRVEHPEADLPRFIAYTTAEGLSSNNVQAVTEDSWGRLYVSTGRGVDRLEPDTGRVRHYTAADGLGHNVGDVSLRDRSGALWFKTDQQTLARFIPQPPEPGSPPSVRISGLRIRGLSYPVSELGEAELSGLALGPNENQIQIDFGSLNFGLGDMIRFQYWLKGVDRGWSALTDLRTVNYASLSSRKYRFLVRAMNADGLVSPKPALVVFTILPPVWQRWWFLSLAALLAGLTIYAVYRYRLARLLELERVRMRIATDLHDDIGSSLSQIAILSEVVSRQVGDEARHVTEPLSEIAGTSRELVDSMSDIVWAIDPRQDRLGDLAGRMRRFAGDILPPRNINFRFRAPTEERDLEVRADLRRQIYLVFKESVNNIARHSGCSEADIEFRMESEWLVLRIQDNGKGFDLEAASKGHGLASMRERARNLGGQIEVMSRERQGTTVTLRVPVRRSAASLWRRLLHKYAGTDGRRHA